MSTPDLTSVWRALLLGIFGQDHEERSSLIDVAPLREFVCEFVRVAKAQGEPSERVIRQLKESTSAAVMELVPQTRRKALLDDVFHWCLDEYYGSTADQAARQRVARDASSIELR